MWRAFFIGIGITLVIFGAQCLVLDRAILETQESVADSNAANSSYLLSGDTPRSKQREWIPKDWHPWSLMSVGAVVILYSYSFSKNAGG